MDGIVFIARLGSTRLPQKHLIKVNGKTFIEWLVERFVHFFKDEILSSDIKLVLATSDEPVNREFESVLKSLPIEIFYGSVNNIPLRILQTAKKFNFQNIVSIDGDDILCSANAAKTIMHKLRETDQAVWFKTTGLALGMNATGYKRAVLELSEGEIGSGKLETGWSRVFNKFECISIRCGDYELRQELRFTLDYEKDAEFFREIISHFGDNTISASDDDIVNYVLENDVARFNRDINEEYWANFNKQMKEEG